MIRGVCVGGCNRGRRKIYVAFTVEQVIKCNYRGAQQADYQEGKETSDQGLFIHAVAPLVSFSFLVAAPGP